MHGQFPPRLESLKRLFRRQKDKSAPHFLAPVIENLPGIVFVKDAKTLSYLQFNRACEKFLGISRQELLGRKAADVFPKAVAERMARADQELLSANQTLEFNDVEIHTRFGTRFVHAQLIPIQDEDGSPLYILGVAEDITERKNLELERLRVLHEQAARAEAEKAAARLSFMAEASAVLSASLNLNQTLNDFAQVVIRGFADWCEIVVVGEDERRLENLVIAHRDAKMVELFREHRKAYSIDWNGEVGIGKVIRTGEADIHGSLSHDDIDQKMGSLARREILRLAHVHTAMIMPLSYSGRILGAIGLCRSSNPESYNDYDLPLGQDLARRVAIAVENSRLYQKAHEASQAKSNFLANMSHEIRTPLSSLLGFADLLNESRLSPQQRRYVHTITQNSQQLLGLVDEILDLSKVESDQMQMEEIEFGLTGLLEEVTSLLALQARNKNLQFRVESVGQLPERVISDPKRLRQILINVIGNAIKFTQFGRVDVTLSLHEGVLEIRVRDTGIGVSPEQRERLFQPFNQADVSTARRFGGTGLGLSLSRRIARLLGGDVVLTDSSPKSGSEFLITVQVQAAAPRAKNENPLPAPVPGAGPANGRVLIVDDAPDNRALIQQYVARLGYKFDTAETGREAVDKALRQNFDVILMDVQMPVMDGFEAVHELRANDYNKPIVALTAHTMKGDRERCLGNGFDDFLGKPVDRDLLRQSLQRYSATTRR